MSKLYGPKQIVLITVSGVIGIGFFLFRRYYETGTLGRSELFGAVFAAVMMVTISVLMIRKGNRDE